MSVRVRFIAIALGLLVLAAVCGCSRENRDWRTAQATDTIEAYGRFLEQHPDGEHAPQAQTRVEQLAEERDWERVSEANTQAAYRQFVVEHPNSKWAQEARIRAENFALDDGLIDEDTDLPAPRDTELSPTNESAVVRMDELPQTGGEASNGVVVSPLPPVPEPLPVDGGTIPDRETIPDHGATAEPGIAPPVSSPPELPSSSFAIQLGAFSSEGKARAEWQRLTSRFDIQLGGLRPEVRSATTAAGRIYRLQAGIETEQQARNTCAALRQGGQACVVVLPSTR